MRSVQSPEKTSEYIPPVLQSSAALNLDSARSEKGPFTVATEAMVSSASTANTSNNLDDSKLLVPNYKESGHILDLSGVNSDSAAAEAIPMSVVSEARVFLDTTVDAGNTLDEDRSRVLTPAHQASEDIRGLGLSRVVSDKTFSLAIDVPQVPDVSQHADISRDTVPDLNGSTSDQRLPIVSDVPQDPDTSQDASNSQDAEAPALRRTVSPHRLSSDTTLSSAPSSIAPSSTAEAPRTYAEKYSPTVVGCGYVRLSCEIIDRWLKFGRYTNLDIPIPTKAAADKTYMKMLDQNAEMSVKEIVVGKYKDAKLSLKGLNVSKAEAMLEKQSEVALQLWADFESKFPQTQVPRATSARTVSATSTVSTASSAPSMGGQTTQVHRQISSIRTLSASSNGNTIAPPMGEQAREVQRPVSSARTLSNSSNGSRVASSMGEQELEIQRPVSSGRTASFTSNGSRVASSTSGDQPRYRGRFPIRLPPRPPNNSDTLVVPRTRTSGPLVTVEEAAEETVEETAKQTAEKTSKKTAEE